MPLVSFWIYLPLKLSIKTNIHNSSQTLADYKAMSKPLLLEPVDRVVHGLRVTLCAVVFGSAIDRFSNLRRAPTHHSWSLQNALNAYIRDAPTRFKDFWRSRQAAYLFRRRSERRPLLPRPCRAILRGQLFEKA